MRTPHFSPQNHRQGFTLIELLVTMAVLAILMGVAAMVLMPWQRSQLVRSDMSELAADFNLYRTKTLSEGQAYRITLSTNQFVVERQSGTTWANVETYTFRRARLNLTGVATQYTFNTRGFVNTGLNTNTTVVGSDGKTSATLRITALGFTRML